jgi:hypothetical protein
MDITFFLALLGLFHFAIATSSENCTFDQISPSKKLTWCPCDNGFLCAKLDVSPLFLIVLPWLTSSLGTA